VVAGGTTTSATEQLLGGGPGVSSFGRGRAGPLTKYDPDPCRVKDCAGVAPDCQRLGQGPGVAGGRGGQLECLGQTGPVAVQSGLLGGPLGQSGRVLVTAGERHPAASQQRGDHRGSGRSIVGLGCELPVARKG
jgi:hypothetical protein